ncbi:hypothetical protein COLO4_33269 [Corchorus olitorius]|uniref:Uncharacterized protein n=1 Tax=Corchorus olitorius TaxID=93759 RepID=A0A1R3GVA8_9ROSI|nr:hypothetical protein COLO4_33269 [Corchorus olitorius]
MGISREGFSRSGPLHKCPRMPRFFEGQIDVSLGTSRLKHLKEDMKLEYCFAPH